MNKCGSDRFGRPMPPAKPETCPECGSNRIADILYGLPHYGYPDLRRDLDEGRIVLGGCLVESGQPRWFCMSCRVPLGTSPEWRAPLSPKSILEMVEGLREENEDQRYWILVTLSALGPPASAIPLLLELARRESGRVSYRAAQAAQAAGCPQDRILAAFDPKSERERATVRRYLAGQAAS